MSEARLSSKFELGTETGGKATRVCLDDIIWRIQMRIDTATSFPTGSSPDCLADANIQRLVSLRFEIQNVAI
jgi:hypothetical protein